MNKTCTICVLDSLFPIKIQDDTQCGATVDLKHAVCLKAKCRAVQNQTFSFAYSTSLQY